METFNFDGSAVEFIPANLSLHANIRKVMHHFLGRIASGFKIELISEAIRSVENSYKSKKKRAKIVLKSYNIHVELATETIFL